ncbi:uncharacterized protein B0H18DRAFT_66712 [Fomitopsis serialis]|uniref:uncharacterized protein n=1 Tax=Fomitopsis serialis TaxID=139415 RepID=UPI00200871F2|nr:uncharacterized protein B0H18DRAFT_66712 [Neoantrodia serialis]KAH9931786.1 hypothetical protein B0H18DRAFT_66712 [Neoantrodia serialis]
MFSRRGANPGPCATALLRHQETSMRYFTIVLLPMSIASPVFALPVYWCVLRVLCLTDRKAKSLIPSRNGLACGELPQGSKCTLRHDLEARYDADVYESHTVPKRRHPDNL